MLFKILITVKTYPTLSVKYEELVCTAGFTENGEWIRIYPIPFRKKDYDERYKKYDWIEINLVKNEKDFRPESYRPVDKDFNIIGHLDTKNNWEERKKYCLKNVYTNLNKLINYSQNPQRYISLATFKPTRIIDFIAEPDEKEWDENKLRQIIARRKQLKLFDEDLDNEFKFVKKLPYKFKYKFVDDNNKESTMMIEDWEIGQLFWNCLKSNNGNEEKAIKDVREKYFNEFTNKRDLYFFLGTTLKYHKRAKNPFIIIGLFYPPKAPKDKTETLFPSLIPSER
jgi:hypothetical protein